MRFGQPEHMSREAAITAIHGRDPTRRIDGILSLALYDSDWKEAQDQCLGLLADADPDVVNTAVLGLGHLARLHHRLDLDVVIPALKALQTDPRFAGRVRDALEDIATFVRE